MQTLKVGFGRQEITPPLGTLLMGYASATRTALRVRDPLYSSALVFDDMGTRTALVSLDVCIIGDEFIRQIREAATKATGIPGANILLCSTHTHSGPCTARAWGWNEPDFPYINELFIPRVVKSIQEAAAAPKPARIGIATTSSNAGVARRGISGDHQMGWHNRTWDIHDPTMTVIRIQGANDAIANIVHYGAHPTVFNGSTRAISRDWPGVVVDRMQSLTGAPTLFINGAFGDIAPRTAFQYAVADGDGESGLAETGGVASLDAMRAWREIKDFRDARAITHTSNYLMPYRELPSLDEAKREVARLEPHKDEYGLNMAGYTYWNRVVAAHSNGPSKGKLFLQTLLAIGPAVFVPVPGEPFADTTLRLRELSPFQYTLVAGMSGGANGYFYTRDSLHRGGYEVDVAKAMSEYLFVENIEDVLITENMKMLKELHPRVYPPMA